MSLRFQCMCKENNWSVFQMDFEHGVCVCKTCNTRLIFTIETITYDC